ncbi:hypothetical protein DYBT9275_01551 [Dyadobacter sp. CECT 9275]|uniref:Fe2OG dioxygenase domain-containing protein n=1 Tax=Dyadobacter helix TaxID=2822344 RepID=A0A916JAI9_9BACT|nr:2OG-Fe(II) oxygenase [Dyadobacter sp. CECT 9275]CAG4995110.1 hypothetical protein DYBT9275_01551 [Dyadobacter sp. CECT 9275]
MPKLLNYHRYENFLDAETAQKLLEYCISQEDAFRDATVNDGVVTKVSIEYRKSMVLKDLGEFKDIMIRRVAEFLPDIFKKLEIVPFDIKTHELEMAAHGDGAFFREHIDTLTGDQEKTNARTLSLVYYFHKEPKQFEGGELSLIPFDFFPGDDKPVALAPLHNSLLVFPSFAPHEVLPVKCPDVPFPGWRFTINYWIYK